MADDQVEQTRRPDGTLRPAVKVKRGYVPPEEQAKYGDRWKDPNPPKGPPGADVGEEEVNAGAAAKNASKTAAKNAKRNAKKKEGRGDENAGQKDASKTPVGVGAQSKEMGAGSSAASPEEEAPVEKKLKALRKRLRQIDDLKDKEASGATLNADQQAKVAARPDLEAEIAKWESLGDGDLAKKVKNLKKKLRQVEELEERMGKGEELNADQQGKVEGKSSLTKEITELEALLAKL